VQHSLSNVRIADSFRDRLVGLIGERAAGRHFLLIPRCSSIHTAFMPAAIDVVFLGAGEQVLGTVENARPWRVFAGPHGTRAVLELPAGYAHAIGLGAGDLVTLD
jgi:uncharacterized membrane protein (UPF0127 family)